MRKLLLILCMLCSVAYGQYTPMNQKYEFKSVLQIDSAYRMLGFNDTTTLNTYKIFVSPGVYQFIKDQPGWMVRVGNSFLMRNAAATAWLEFVNIGSGSTSSALTWNTNLNRSPSDPTPLKFGNMDSFPIKIYTNNIKCLEIAAAGIALQAISGSWQYAAYNTSTKELGYAHAPINDTFDFPVSEFKLTAINAHRKRVELDTAGAYVPSKHYVDSSVAAGGGGSFTGWDDMLAQGQAQTDIRQVELGDHTFRMWYDVISSNLLLDVSGSAVALYSASGNGISLLADSIKLTQSNASNDTAAFKPLGISSSGGLAKINYWPSGGASSPAGNDGNIQINRNGIFDTPGDDSLSMDAGILNVKGDFTATGFIIGQNNISITGNSNNVFSGDDASTNYVIGRNDETRLNIVGAAGGNFGYFWDDGSSSFKLGINTNSPTANFHLVGDMLTTGTIQFSNFGAGAATFDASGNISSVSDERLKKNIHPYTYGLKEILGINPITYQWNNKQKHDTIGVYAGFSAQNVKANLPLGTDESKTGEKYLSLQDRTLLAALVNSVKELSAKLDTQESVNKKQATEIKKLKLKLNHKK